MNFESKVALVTGGSRGIGRAIALELGRLGASVMINCYQCDDAPDAELVKNEIESNGGRADIYQADVSDFSQAEALVNATIESFDDINILVNNAGITRDGLIMTMAEGDWDAVIATNLKSTFNCSKPAVRHMMRKRMGRIINISSISGVMGNAGQTNYSASKAGIIGFTKALAREVAPRNVTVNTVAPGFIETKILDTIPEEVKTNLMGAIPLGRVGQAEEVAKAVAFLASDDAAYITGHVLVVDGGMAM